MTFIFITFYASLVGILVMILYGSFRSHRGHVDLREIEQETFHVAHSVLCRAVEKSLSPVRAVSKVSVRRFVFVRDRLHGYAVHMINRLFGKKSIKKSATMSEFMQDMHDYKRSIGRGMIEEYKRN